MRSSSDALDRKRRRAGPSLGIGLSLIVHLIGLAALVVGVRHGFEVESVPAADVELIPAWPRGIHRRLRAERPTPPARSRDVASPSRRRIADAASTDGEPSSLSPTPVQPPATPVPGQAPASALRLGLGCDHQDFTRLTAEQRAACRDRFASRTLADRDYADAAIAPSGRAFDARSKAETFLRGPFLSAMPKKGCRPRVTEHDAAAFGKSQPDITVQATCVVRF